MFRFEGWDPVNLWVLSLFLWLAFRVLTVLWEEVFPITVSNLKPMVLKSDRYSIPLETYPNNGCIYTWKGSEDNRNINGNSKHWANTGQIIYPCGSISLSLLVD